MKTKKQIELKPYYAPYIQVHIINLEDGISRSSIVYTTDKDGKIYEQREVDVTVDDEYTW